jgi:uncharacterized protein (TIGR02996 family)
MRLVDKEEPFLKEISAHPDDDHPRLVFADWLEEQGDPRGEFIRVQCALAAAAVDSPERQSLETLDRRMLAEVRPTVLARLKPLGVGDVRFSRGFVEKALVQGNGLVGRTSLLYQEAPALRGLMLRGWLRPQADALGRVFQSPALACLTSLDASQNAFGTPGAWALARAPWLRQLVSLNLAQNRLAGQGIQELAAEGDARWATLILTENELSVSDARALAQSSRVLELKTLMLDRNRLGDDGARAIAHAKHLSALETLSVADNELGVSGVRALAEALYLTRLQTLSLATSLLGQTGAALIASAAVFAKLKSLCLADCQIDAEAARALAVSPYLRQLTALDLSRNEIGNGVRALAESSNFAQVQELNLSSNNLNRRDVQALLADGVLPALTRLDLRDNELGDEAALRERFGDRVLL